jgi:hypothetical protein
MVLPSCSSIPSSNTHESSPFPVTPVVLVLVLVVVLVVVLEKKPSNVFNNENDLGSDPPIYAPTKYDLLSHNP